MNDAVLKYKLRNWKYYLAEGIALVLLGIIALSMPVFTSIATTLVLAWILIFGGVAQLFLVYKNKDNSSILISLFSAVLMFVVGMLILFYPAHGVITVTAVFSAYLLVQGVMQIFYAFTIKELNSWGLMLLSGVFSIILAIMIWSNWPINMVSFLGIVIGIYLLFWGVSLIVLAFDVRKLHQRF